MAGFAFRIDVKVKAVIVLTKDIRPAVPIAIVNKGEAIVGVVADLMGPGPIVCLGRIDFDGLLEIGTQIVLLR